MITILRIQNVEASILNWIVVIHPPDVAILRIIELEVHAHFSRVLHVHERARHRHHHFRHLLLSRLAVVDVALRVLKEEPHLLNARTTQDIERLTALREHVPLGYRHRAHDHTVHTNRLIRGNFLARCTSGHVQHSQFGKLAVCRQSRSSESLDHVTVRVGNIKNDRLDSRAHLLIRNQFQLVIHAKASSINTNILQRHAFRNSRHLDALNMHHVQRKTCRDQRTRSNLVVHRKRIQTLDVFRDLQICQMRSRAMTHKILLVNRARCILIRTAGIIRVTKNNAILVRVQNFFIRA